MRYNRSDNPYTEVNTQRGVFRQMIGLQGSLIRPDDLALTLRDRKIDSIPPDVLLALQKISEQDRVLSFLMALKGDLKFHPVDDQERTVSDIGRCAGAALVRLLRHEHLPIRHSAAMMLAQLGAELAFIPIAVLGRAGTIADGYLADSFERNLPDSRRELFYKYKKVAEEFGELRPSDFKRAASDQKSRPWWDSHKNKFIVLGGLCHKDPGILRTSLKTIVASSTSSSFPRPFWHPHMQPSLCSGVESCYNSYLQIEAMLALASSFILHPATPLRHQQLFLQVCAGLASSPLLGAVIEDYASKLSTTMDTDVSGMISVGHALYVATMLLPTENRQSPISKLIELINHPVSEVSLIAFNTLWDLPPFINSLSKDGRTKTTTQLFELLKKECKQPRSTVWCETIADIIGTVRGIDLHLQSMVVDLIKTMPNNVLAKDAYQRILAGLCDNTTDRKLREKLEHYLWGK